MPKRNTIQQQLVYNAVRQLNCHPTADEVYDAVASAHPSISKGTVYRNLGKLTDAGTLRRIQIPNSADRYDPNAGEHYHICCKTCGEFKDIAYPYLLNLNGEIEADTGYRLEDHDIVFVGICSKCVDKCP